MVKGSNKHIQSLQILYHVGKGKNCSEGKVNSNSKVHLQNEATESSFSSL